jgi:uncharacterized protein YprB with RNaseH-like and TPR domain
MQLDCQEFLNLVEETNRLFFFDIETTGLNCDYNSVLCVSIKPFGKAPITFSVEQPGNDKRVVREASEFLSEASAWVTFYGKGFDVPMLEGRLLKWGLPSLDKKPHMDVYFTVKHKVNPSRKSMAHICRWLHLPEKKMDVNPDEWNNILNDCAGVMRRIMKPRCESDCTALEGVYKHVRHLAKDITR